MNKEEIECKECGRPTKYKDVNVFYMNPKKGIVLTDLKQIETLCYPDHKIVKCEECSRLNVKKFV